MVKAVQPSRKERRRQERARKRLRKRLRHQTEEPLDDEEVLEEEATSTNELPVKTVEKHSMKEKHLKKKQKTGKSNDPYAHLDPATAAAMRRDDEEIADLEAKLRLGDKKEKSRLHKEYSKLEAYGDDFGEFLDDLDGMMKRITQGSRARDNDKSDEESDRDSSDKGEKRTAKKNESKKKNLYDTLDADTAAALRKDDEEIAALEAKLGISDKKEKKRLHKEYATLECYGEDFGEFLDDLDGIVERVVNGKDCDDKVGRDPRDDNDSQPDFSDHEDEEEDEIVPMKEPSIDDLDEDDSVMAEIENQDDVTEVNLKDDSESDSDTDGESEDSGQEPVEDHDTGLTYRPTKGQDIYGNIIEFPKNSAKPQKYVPPHLRKKQDSSEAVDDQQRQQSLLQIQRSLNNPLNRLSEDTLISVSQEIAKVYPLHPTSDVNECIWKSTKNTCIARSHLMTGLIPVFLAAVCGVHVINGDSSQLGEYIMEKIVVDLWKEIKVAREKVTAEDTVQSDADLVAKEASNLMLCLCYLYNFGVVHCSLMYDVVRDFIESFKEIDVELLLLILNHCGRALRSDDPSALKDIVLLVQKRALETKDTTTNASRIDYMVSAILDLKNNKRRNQSAAFVEKTARLKKILGQIKSSVASSSGGFRAESSLRISLSDLLNADTQGRFWKVGASWVGNQFRFHDGDNRHASKTETKSLVGVEKETPQHNEEDAKLSKLATKYRMNTDVRRSVFCIIMGSADCDDAFEKLVRAEMLKNRTERETARVLMECCGNEKSFNKYYAHLAARICEFQPQCKFSFQLAFWDMFKTFEQTKARKAANLAKLLFHLVAMNFALRLSVLKAIDMSSPDELSEAAMIFVTIFLSSILEHFDDPADVVRLIETGIKKHQAASEGDELGQMDEGEALRANLTVFFVQVLKASPKYKKGSRFRANLKAAIKACDTDNFF